MEQKRADGAAPFGDTSTLSGVRQGQSDFGARVGRLGRKAAPAARERGTLFEPSRRESGLTALYLHGGGYVSGNGAYAHGVAALFAEKLGLAVFAADYALAPEHPYPAALDDAEGAYRAILSEGAAPERLILLGDSSGGGLCFALLIRLKEKELPLPKAVVALSPWCDLTMAEYGPGAGDGMLDVPLLKSWAADYGGGADLQNPELSPLRGDLTGFPPCLLFAGGNELLKPDSRRMAAALEKAGVPCTLTVAPDQGHTYPLTGTKEAKAALGQMREFLAQL